MYLIKLIGLSKVLITTCDSNNIDVYKLAVMNGNNLLHVVNHTKIKENSIILFLKENINIKYYTYIIYNNFKIKAIYNDLFCTKEFNDKFCYDGDLGLDYSKSCSTFKLWSPAAISVSLLLYKNGDPNVIETPKEYPMHEEDNVWVLKLNQDLKDMFYTYKINVYGNSSEVTDPYAKAVGINGLRGAIIDLKETDPPNFKKDTSPKINHNTDAIIYEISVRDISFDESSNTSKNGKFLALCENSNPFNHIKDLGVTHVQLMPCFDFSYTSLDERDAKNYNWGYNPQNYNVPEGSYSSNPYEPKYRIMEMKKMIQHFHENNISVNMDVVYNHLFHKSQNIFEKIFPGYYFRFDNNGNFSNGSGCGNDTASEHKMVRKFIIDSLIYWEKEYHIDGFRFDLMGLHDIYTMKSIDDTFKHYNRHIMLYGEGWNLVTNLNESLRATQKNAKLLPNIAFFNDITRDTIKGNVFSASDRGFANGKDNLEELLRYCVTACTIENKYNNSIYSSPEQSINYVSCHDNYTLWDKLQLSNGNDDISIRKDMVKLSNGIILTSQGVPFLHSGVEFCRTKNKIENSFKSPDSINSLNYNRKNKFIDVYNYHKELIKIRKKHPAFRMYNTDDLNKHLEFIKNTPQNTVAFMLKNHANGDSWKSILVIYNANRHPVNLKIPFAKWNIVVNKDTASTEIIKTIHSDSAEVDSISMTIMYSLE